MDGVYAEGRSQDAKDVKIEPNEEELNGSRTSSAKDPEEEMKEDIEKSLLESLKAIAEEEDEDALLGEF